jgi:hypothetical protein
MRTLLPLLFAPCLALAATSIVSIEPTATQAIVRVATDQTGSCTYRASESNTFTPLSHDVDQTLFPGANSDARTGAIVNGTSHVFVLGTRTAAKAADGKFYSRALQANTQHWVGVTCGQDAEVTQSFQTVNPPLGNTYPDTPPFDPQGFGNYAWPNIDWTDRTQSYIDPMTGILIKRMTDPADMGNTTPTMVFKFALGNGAWSNAANAVSGTTVNLASINGDSTSGLFVGVGPTAQYAGGGGTLFNLQPGFADNSIDDMAVYTYGNGTATSSTDDRTIEVCLTVDSGQTCATTPPLEVVLPVAPAMANPAAKIPATFPSAGFKGWGAPAPIRRDLILPMGVLPYGGGQATVNVANNSGGGATATLIGTPASWNTFTSWAPGSKIYIAGSAPACTNNYCTISSIQGGSSLVIAEQPGTLSGVAYNGANFGIKVVKKTAVGQVNVSFNYAMEQGGQYSNPASGAFNQCSRTPIVVSGQTGYLCTGGTINSVLAPLYFFIPASGSVSFISILQNPCSPPWQCTFGGDLYEGDAVRFQSFSSDGFSAYMLVGVRNSSGGYLGSVVAQATWNPNTSALTWTNLTPFASGHGLTTLMANASWSSSKDAAYLTKPGIGVGMQGVAAGRYAILSAAASQDAPNLLASLDLQAPGGPAIVSATDTWSSSTLRWAAVHTTNADENLGTYAYLGVNPIGSRQSGDASHYWGGPFQVFPTQIWKNGAWSSDTSLSTSTNTAAGYADTCPSTINSQWQSLVGQQKCIHMQLRGEPCSSWAGAQELSDHPCPWDKTKSYLQDLAEGDLFTDVAGNWTNEQFRVVQKIGSTEIWAERWVGSGCQLGPFGNMGTCGIHANGWAGTMEFNGAIGQGGTAWFGLTATAIQADLTASNMGSQHSDVGTGVDSGKYTWVTGEPADVRYNLTASGMISAPSTALETIGGTYFAGAYWDPGDMVENYPSLRQWDAPASEKVWYLDWRAYLPASGFSVGLERNTVTRVPGTSQVYQVSISGTPNTPDLKRGTLTAWAGYHLLQDMSGPGSVITDSNVWQYCYAYNTGECVSGSSAGAAYLNVPMATVLSPSSCMAASYYANFPCIRTTFPMGGSGVQVDLSQPDPNMQHFRRLTMGLSGPGRQFDYANWRSTPDGQWAIFQSYWADGYRNDFFVAKLPPWPGVDPKTARNDYVRTRPISLAGTPSDTIRIRFGYAENGPPEKLYCTSRQETCATDGSGVAPFLFASEPQQYKTCGRECTVQIPAISGRIVYYQMDRQDGGVARSGSLQVFAAP